MKIIFSAITALVASLATNAVYSATISGTVINKTTNKPSAGDAVVLVDVSAGMGDAARAVTDSDGHYSLMSSGGGTYLIRVDHQGGSYFIGVPQGSAPADVTVYDVAARVEGVGIDADMLLIEASGGSLRVRERYLVRNTSTPPRTQFSENTFEVAIPDGALVDEAAATRPGGLGTRTHLVPLTQKGHYAFNVPIQPDQGEKETLFEVQYHFAYNGKHQLAARPQMAADNVVVYTAKGIDFSANESSRFKATQEDPRVETHVVHNVQPDQEIAFTVSGEGQMPPDANGVAIQPTRAALGGLPGGRTGSPMAAPDPLTRSSMWLFSAFAIVLVALTFLFVRRRNGALVGFAAQISATVPEPMVLPDPSLSARQPPVTANLQRDNVILESLKDEFFSLEKDRISGRITEEEYARLQGGLEALLKRAVCPKS